MSSGLPHGALITRRRIADAQIADARIADFWAGHSLTDTTTVALSAQLLNVSHPQAPEGPPIERRILLAINL